MPVEEATDAGREDGGEALVVFSAGTVAADAVAAGVTLSDSLIVMLLFRWRSLSRRKVIWCTRK